MANYVNGCADCNQNYANGDYAWRKCQKCKSGFKVTNRFVLLFLLSLVNVIQGEKFQLHDYMDESELKFYFNDLNGFSTGRGLPDYELVNLEARQKRKARYDDLDTRKRELNFRAFEQSIHLDLHPNDHLISPRMRVVAVGGERGSYEEIIDNGSDGRINRSCFYLHRNGESVGAFSNCQGDDFVGIILMPNETFEVQPLTNRLKSVLSREGYERNLDTMHFIRRVYAPDVAFGNDSRTVRNSKILEQGFDSLRAARGYIPAKGKVIIEVGVFFDEAAYKTFAPFFDHDDAKLTEMILAYMNAVQAIYHHASLGIPVDISIVHIELMQKQPHTLPHHNGEREGLLDSFCAYQRRLNPPGDHEPNHWDMGLYISGLDFYSYENGFNSGATMGLATVRGVCTPAYSCVIAEFGTTNAFRRPYPSAGFTSVYIMAHEIGHNLGMAHDSTGNYCAKEGYIMSPSRGTQGETSWSSCSAEIARDLPNWATCLQDRPEVEPVEYDAWKFNGYPGQVWSAKRQCELLLIDNDAVDSPTSGSYSICQNLQCRSPHRSGYFFAGPALEGTTCGRNMWCEGGYCTPKKEIERPKQTIPGGWGPWTKNKCASACIYKSRGFLTRRRVCDNPKPVSTNEGCEGSSYEVELCDDTKLCSSVKRYSPISYASSRCKVFSQKLSTLDRRGYGLQAPHEHGRLWMACAIFCRRANSLSYYTPRLELNDLGVDAYFPDGTWCHSESGSNYYCQQHHCLPEGFQFGKFNVWALSEDVPISGNANPNPRKPMNEKIRDYLSLDMFGHPLRTVLKKEDIDDIMKNEVWTDDLDYRDMPRYHDTQYLID